jgi:hypothetical protein
MVEVQPPSGDRFLEACDFVCWPSVLINSTMCIKQLPPGSASPSYGQKTVFYEGESRVLPRMVEKEDTNLSNKYNLSSSVLFERIPEEQHFSIFLI